MNTLVKRRLLAWTCLLHGCLVAAIATTSHALTIADNGQVRAVIVVAADATPPQRHAADELAAFLAQITGGPFPIVHQPDATQANLLVGPGAAAMVDADFSVEGLTDEGIIIRSVGNNLILAGGEPRGTLYAVYTFLEDRVGCRWWTPSASLIPHRPTLEISELNVRYLPPIEYRDTTPADPDGDFSVRNKLNGHNQKLFIDDAFHNVRQDAARGGRKYAYIRSDKWGAHGMWTLIEPEVYFADHPDWFALINGQRTHVAPNYHVSNLCLSNEEMRREMVNNARLALRWNPHASLLSIEQPDDAGPPERCECDRCRAVEAEEGGPSGSMVRFVNSVAADLKEQFPDVATSTLAYHYTQKPPLKSRPDPNVIVRLCNIRASFSRPLSDPKNADFTDDLVGWSKITNRLYVWYYLPNFTYYLPHPNLRTLDANVKFLVEHNVKGLFGEAVAARNMEMSELRTWMWAKLLWNPRLDGRALIDEFCRNYYGPAGERVIRYINLMHDSVESTDDHLGLGSPPDAAFLSFKTLDEAWAHLAAAESAVRDAPELLRRVQRVQLPVLCAFLYRWSALQEQARSSGADWPMPQAYDDARAQFNAAATEQNINLSNFSMPSPP